MCHIYEPEPLFLLVLSLLLSGGVNANSIYFKNCNEQVGEREGGKGIRDKAISNNQYGLDKTTGYSNIPQANKI